MRLFNVRRKCILWWWWRWRRSFGHNIGLPTQVTLSGNNLKFYTKSKQTHPKQSYSPAQDPASYSPTQRLASYSPAQEPTSSSSNIQSTIPLPDQDDKKKDKQNLIIIVVVSTTAVIIIVIFIVRFIKRKNKLENGNVYGKFENVSGQSSSQFSSSIQS